MELEQQPPEVLFEQARKEMQEGHIIVAHRLLTLAVERAPEELKYRQALEETQRRLGSSSMLGDLFEEEDETAGPEEQLGPVGSSGPVGGEEDYLAALTAFSESSPDQQSSARKSQNSSKNIFERTVKEALTAGNGASGAETKAALKKKAAKPTKDPKKVVRKKSGKKGAEGEAAGSIVRRLQIGFFFLLIGVVGVLVWTQQPKRVDVSSYTDVLPFSSAIKPGQEPEVVFTLEVEVWKQMKFTDRRLKVRQLQESAEKQGYQRVYIYSAQGVQLATGAPGMVWLASN